MANEKPQKNGEQKPTPPSDTQVALAILISVLITAYTVGIVSGFIPPERKIDTVNLAIIALAILGVILLIYPEALSRLKLLEMAGFKLELLDEVKEKQAEQESELEVIRSMLPLLLRDTEREHLFNLDTGNTGGYQGRHSLRSELRRIRSMGLIRMRSKGYVADMKGDLTFDLADYVELTELGKWWVNRIRQIEK